MLKLLNMVFFATVIVTTLIIGTLANHSAIDDVTKCRITGPDLDNCLLKALNSLRPQAAREGKQINSPSIEPFVIPMVNIFQESPLVNYNITGRNVIIRGMENFDLKNVKFDPTSMTFRARVEYDPLPVDADYEIEGNLISIPIKGQGKANYALGPINASVEVYGEMDKHKGINYYNPSGIKIRMIIDDMGMYYDGLFDQNKELARMTNEALNANSKIIANAVTPALEDLGEKVFLKPIKSISKKVLSA